MCIRDRIEFALYDDAGNLVGSAFDIINDLEPGETWRFTADVFENSATHARFKGITAF
ncbi:MAG: FxLYD domain-containing protein [Armatimonadetes bacterium]|nr:FxLYD domain-containing protein [Armatimonadota bacterium]